MARSVFVMEDLEDDSTDDRFPAPQKFFCHVCKVEIDSVSQEFKCPICNKGFIEELPPAPDANTSGDTEMSEDNQPIFALELNNRLTDEISSLLMSVTGAQMNERDNQMDSQHAGSVGAAAASNAGAGSSSGGGGGGGVAALPGGGTSLYLNRGSHRVRRRNFPNFQEFDNIVHDFLVSLNGGAAGSPMVFMGNPADYVFGREGLDTIVTQLLNQMDGTGPPPLAKDKIAEIPKVTVSPEQVAEKLQCSICWEDFQLDEPVRKLPCVHIYHENCIVPWLELHGTCPVCRKTLNNENPDEQQQAVVADVTNSLRNVAAMYRYEGGGGSGGGPSDPSGSRLQLNQRRQTRSATRQQAQQQQQHQEPQDDRMRDDDGNVEFDFD